MTEAVASGRAEAGSTTPHAASPRLPPARGPALASTSGPDLPSTVVPARGPEQRPEGALVRVAESGAERVAPVQPGAGGGREAVLYTFELPPGVRLGPAGLMELEPLSTEAYRRFPHLPAALQPLRGGVSRTRPSFVFRSASGLVPERDPNGIYNFYLVITHSSSPDSGPCFTLTRGTRHGLGPCPARGLPQRLQAGRDSRGRLRILDRSTGILFAIFLKRDRPPLPQGASLHENRDENGGIEPALSPGPAAIVLATRFRDELVPVLQQDIEGTVWRRVICLGGLVFFHCPDTNVSTLILPAEVARRDTAVLGPIRSIAVLVPIARVELAPGHQEVSSRIAAWGLRRDGLPPGGRGPNVAGPSWPPDQPVPVAARSPEPAAPTPPWVRNGTGVDLGGGGGDGGGGDDDDDDDDEPAADPTRDAFKKPRRRRRYLEQRPRRDHRLGFLTLLQQRGTTAFARWDKTREMLRSEPRWQALAPALRRPAFDAYCSSVAPAAEDAGERAGVGRGADGSSALGGTSGSSAGSTGDAAAAAARASGSRAEPAARTSGNRAEPTADASRGSDGASGDIDRSGRQEGRQKRSRS